MTLEVSCTHYSLNSAIKRVLDSEDVEEASPSASGESQSRAAERWLLVFAVTTLIVSLVSLALLVVDAHTQWSIYDLLGAVVLNSKTDEGQPDPGLLERPSVYSALDKLPQEVSQAALPDTLTVFPPFFQPVDHVHRNYVFPPDGHARFTFNGRVSPGDHRILLTDHVRSILRVHRPWGWELTRISFTAIDHDGSSIPCA